MRRGHNVPRMRSALLQKLPEVLNQVFAVLPTGQLMIPHSLDQEAASGEESVAVAIVLLLIRKSVARTVEFNRQLRFEAAKIQIETLCDALASKFVSRQPARTKQFPEPRLCPGGLSAQLTCPICGHTR